MVTANILAFDPCTTTNYEDLTRYFTTGLHTILILILILILIHLKSNLLEYSKHYQADDIKGCLLATIVRFVPFKDL